MWSERHRPGRNPRYFPRPSTNTLIENINGRKISPWTGQHVALQDADVPMMDNADGRMLEAGLNRGNSCACLPKLWQGYASRAAGRSLGLAARPDEGSDTSGAKTQEPGDRPQ